MTFEERHLLPKWFPRAQVSLLLFFENDVHIVPWNSSLHWQNGFCWCENWGHIPYSLKVFLPTETTLKIRNEMQSIFRYLSLCDVTIFYNAMHYCEIDTSEIIHNYLKGLAIQVWFSEKREREKTISKIFLMNFLSSSVDSPFKNRFNWLAALHILNKHHVP